MQHINCTPLTYVVMQLRAGDLQLKDDRLACQAGIHLGEL
jgi:hypothetical protein